MLILKTETYVFDTDQEYKRAMEFKENTANEGWEMAYTTTAITFTKNYIAHIDLGKEK